MGVLDRLDQEAAQARQRREAAARARSREESAALARLAPAADRAGRYLERLAGSLGELGRSIEARYPIEGVGVLDGLRQHDYRVARTGDDGTALAFRFECIGPKPLEATIAGHPQAEALARRLREARLSCRLQPAGARAMRLRIEAKVPVRVEIEPDTGRGLVWIVLRNLTALGDQRYGLEPERIDTPLLDALASLVLREPSDFDRLTGSVVDPAQRADLRREIAREQRRRDAELAGGLRRLLFPVCEWFRRRLGAG